MFLLIQVSSSSLPVIEPENPIFIYDTLTDTGTVEVLVPKLSPAVWGSTTEREKFSGHYPPS